MTNMAWMRRTVFSLAILCLAATSAWAQSGAIVLKPADLAKLIPPSVYYHGQTAPTQLRNSGGIKFDDGFYVLASLVDTSGYSTGIASRYQACLIAEVPIKINDKNLAAGAYGIGFTEGDKLVVTDLGAHDVLMVDSATDTSLKRPVPLQIVTGEGGAYRLYAGRRYVTLTR
jgi:hypothetical protein